MVDQDWIGLILTLLAVNFSLREPTFDGVEIIERVMKHWGLGVSDVTRCRCHIALVGLGSLALDHV